MALPEDTPAQKVIRERWVTKPPGIELPEDNPQQTPGQQPKKNTRQQAEYDVAVLLQQLDETRAAHAALQSAYDALQAQLGDQ